MVLSKQKMRCAGCGTKTEPGMCVCVGRGGGGCKEGGK